MPTATLLSEALKVVQTSGLTLIIHELDGFPRQIYTDGRALPKKIEFPSFLGYSIGRWDGDTFVVDTATTSPAIVSPEVASQLGLKTEGKKPLTDLQGGPGRQIDVVRLESRLASRP